MDLKKVWRLLPLHTRFMIICFGAGFILAGVLILAMCGGVDSYAKKIDNIAETSSEAFTVKWTLADEQEEIYDFDNGKTQKDTDRFYLVAKRKVRLTGLIIGTPKLEEDITVKIIALGLPKKYKDTDESEDPESGAGESGTTPDPDSGDGASEGDETEDTELGELVLKAGSSEHHLALTKMYTIPENLLVFVSFDKNIALQFLAVDFKD